jgi:hypothetical protein
MMDEYMAACGDDMDMEEKPDFDWLVNWFANMNL